MMMSSIYLLNENGERCELSPGDRLIIPAGALHAEGQVTEPVTYIVTTREPQPFVEALSMLDPSAWPEPRLLEPGRSASG